MLGYRRAVARVLGQSLHGAPAWALRRAYYLAQLPTVEPRVRLLIDWLAGLPFDPDIV